MIYEGIDRWNSPYIEHHGVKGMKWGVRKQIQSLGNRIQAYRTKRHEDSRVYKRKGLSTGQKVAMGVGVAAVAVGGVIAYKHMQRSMGTTFINGMAEGLRQNKVGKAVVDRLTDKSNTERKAIYKAVKSSGSIGKNASILGKRVVETPTMKTPVKFVTQGPSTIRKTAAGKGLMTGSNKSFLSSMGNMNAQQARNSYLPLNVRTAAQNRAMYLSNTNSTGVFTNTYKPRYATSSGKKVGRLVNYAKRR